MFNPRSKSETSADVPAPQGGATIIAATTTFKGDINSNGDIRIDGNLQGNVHCTAKVVIGANGIVEGDITGQQADIMGRVSGTIKVKELLQLKGGCNVNGNIHAAKLQIETSANFNGQCHMTGSPSAATASPSAVSQNRSAKPVASPSFS